MRRGTGDLKDTTKSVKKAAVMVTLVVDLTSKSSEDLKQSLSTVRKALVLHHHHPLAKEKSTLMRTFGYRDLYGDKWRRLDAW
jgi:hypothetical protein